MKDGRDKPSHPAIAKTLGVFRHRPLLLFWIGAFISNTGNWTENAAQSWAVTSQTVGNPHQGFYVEMLRFADFCPVLILALLAGVISDRVNRKTWRIIPQAVAGVLGAGLAVAAIIGVAGVAGAFTLNACTFLPLLFVLLFFIPSIPRPPRTETTSVREDIHEGLRFVWKHQGTRRLTIMGLIFMLLSAPLQGLLPVFAQSVLKGGPGLFGLMLSAIGLGSILGAFLLAYIPAYYPRHHLIPLSMSVFAAIGVLFSFSTVPAVSLIILVASGMCWLLSLNASNTANQLLATDANRGRVLSGMLLAQQGGMPLGHLFAGYLTHYMSPQWVLRLMLGTLLVVMPFFLFRREPAIDSMARRRPGKMPIRQAIWEALTAASHRPAYPGEVCVETKENAPSPSTP